MRWNALFIIAIGVVLLTIGWSGTNSKVWAIISGR